ncbi:MAG TPA: chemotaxis protein CheB, partial [Candidatus Binataceae bacterium]|nr:chemotaxis protein CheB [Candidatus Binataceae bacterium]
MTDPNINGYNRVVVIGASAGGPEAVSTVLRSLDPDFPAAVMVVIHLAPESPGYLVPILQKATSLPVRSGCDQPMAPGSVYVAQPDTHLVIERGMVRATRAPRENRFRPSADVTFRSAAFAYRQGVIGVVMTGLLDDGTAGLFYVKRHGGTTIVQDPRDARFSSMPENALTHIQVDYVAKATEIGLLLNRLVREPKGAKVTVSIELPNQKAKHIFVRRPESGPSENSILEEDEKHAEPSAYTCPDCGGSLFQIKDGKLTRFRCRTGHAYALNTLLQNKNMRVEEIMASAEAALMEATELLTRAAEEAHANNRPDHAAELDKEISRARR